MAWRIGVDIGGTFTDVALVEEERGEIRIAKVATTPEDFGRGVVEALETALGENGVSPGQVSLLAHATTIVTNALLEERGARTALVTTRGFRDVLELRRSARSDLYDLFQDAPSTLVPRHARLEVTERIDAQGEIVTPLAEAEIGDIIEFVREHRIEAVAVSLLFSFLNGSHERVVGERLRSALPDIPVFLSSEILPEIREFERTSTTAVCAYVGPILASYLARLQSAVEAMGLPRLHVMGSSGGIFDVAEGLRMPAAAVESGPAAGVVAATLVARQLHRPDLISFDMGGTTAKASLVAGGEVTTTPEYEVGGQGSGSRWLHGTGHPIRVPVIDLAEVSAGGGSVAWVDPGGALRVGPRSAGAVPGPVCYGRGGEQPTVTDANVVLGYLDRGSLLGGALPIDAEAAEAAIERHVARPLGLGVTEAAAGIISVVENSMAAALRIVSVERGHDPREFALVAFGGAGPLHAARLAEELEIPEVIVPPASGAFSALGLVASDIRRDWVRTLYLPLADATSERLGEIYGELEAAGRRMLVDARVPEDRRALQRAADLRYARQAYELTVPVEAGPIGAHTLEAMAAAFHEKHKTTYGHESRSEPVHLVNVRLSAIGRLTPLRIHQSRAEEGRARRERAVTFRETGAVSCPVIWRGTLAGGDRVEGPAILEALDSTVVVPPGWGAATDGDGFISMRRNDRA